MRIYRERASFALGRWGGLGAAQRRPSLSGFPSSSSAPRVTRSVPLAQMVAATACSRSRTATSAATCILRANVPWVVVHVLLPFGAAPFVRLVMTSCT